MSVVRRSARLAHIADLRCEWPAPERVPLFNQNAGFGLRRFVVTHSFANVAGVHYLTI